MIEEIDEGKFIEIDNKPLFDIPEEPKRDKIYLSNEQVEREEKELVSIYVRYLHSTGGVVECRFAYIDDVEDKFKITKDGEIVLGKVYPSQVLRQIKSRIKEHAPNAKPKAERKEKAPTIMRIKREQPTVMIINRNLINNNEDGENTPIN